MTTFGLFDSGVGGLSVLNAMLTRHPGLSAVYLADTAWVPYGDKDPQALKRRIERIIQWLTPQAQCLVVACNTSAALMECHWPTPLPVLDPITETAHALAHHPVRRVAVLATPNTVATGAYPAAIRASNPGISVTQCACPGLADAVESGEFDPIMPQLSQWLTQLIADQPEQLILGCTHYPFATAVIQTLLQDLLVTLPLFNPAESIAAQLSDLPADMGKIRLFTTGDPALVLQQVARLDLHPAIRRATVEAVTPATFETALT